MRQVQSLTKSTQLVKQPGDYRVEEKDEAVLRTPDMNDKTLLLESFNGILVDAATSSTQLPDNG